MKTFGWRRMLGIIACLLLIISCFMNWAWYPDIEKFFTGFFSQNNYYGKPGILLSIFAGAGILLFIIGKVWSVRLNLLIGAIATAYAVANYLKYSSGYDGIEPEKQPGIYIMLISTLVFLVISFISANVRKVEIPIEEPTTEK